MAPARPIRTKHMHTLLKRTKDRESIWNTTQKELSPSGQDIGPTRWFILFWVSIVSLWGSAQMLLGENIRLPLGGFMLFIGLRKWDAMFALPGGPPLSKEIEPPPILEK